MPTAAAENETGVFQWLYEGTQQGLGIFFRELTYLLKLINSDNDSSIEPV